MFHLFLLLSALVPNASSCAATSGGGTVTTTAATTSCTGCTANSVNLAAENPNDANSHAPTAAAGTLQGGCSTLVITCTPINNNPESLLTFQNGLGGPLQGNPSTATLVCNTMNQWVYTNMGISTVITDAFCLG